MTIDELIFAICVALFNGYSLSFGPYWVGPHDDHFVCFNQAGLAIPAFHRFNQLDWLTMEEKFEFDASAFGAALSFVAAAGLENAVLALEEIPEAA